MTYFNRRRIILSGILPIAIVMLPNILLSISNSIPEQSEINQKCIYYIDSTDYYKFCNPSKALEFAKNARSECDYLDNDSLLIESFLRIGILYEFINNTDLSLKNYDSAIAICDKKNMLNKKSFLLLKKADAYRTSGQMILALQSNVEAINISQENNIINQLSKAYLNLGIFYYYMLLDNKKALYFFNKSLENEHKTEKKEKLVLILSYLAGCQSRNNNYDSANATLRKARNLLNTTKNKFDHVHYYREAASHFSRIKDYLLSLKLADSAIAIANETRDCFRIADMNTLKGFCYSQLNLFDKADTVLKKALTIRQTLGNQWHIASSMLNLGGLYLKRHMLDKAFVNIQNGLRIAKKYNSIAYTKNAYWLLYDYYTIKSNHLKALENFKEYKKYSDLETEKKHSDKILALELSYETKESENLIKLLDEQSKNKTTIIIFGVITSFLLFTIMYISYRYKAKSNKILKEKNKLILQKKDDLNKLNLELKATLASRNKVISIVAHDLSNPILWQMKMIGTLSEDWNKKPEQKIKELITYIHGSSRNTYFLVDNLLQWSRTQTGTLKIYKDHFRFLDFVELVIGELSYLVDSKSIKIAINIPKDLTIEADKNIIKIILRNILINAIKFSYKNGEVSIKHETRNNIDYCTVRDNGIGIEQELLDQLVYGNITNNGTHNEIGNGIGLMFCRELIYKYNGDFRISSEPKKGAEISFSI